jgi:hypothetical protein
MRMRYLTTQEALTAAMDTPTVRNIELALDSESTNWPAMDDWSPEAREAAAKSRQHLHISASHESNTAPKFKATAGSHAEAEKHLAALHEHVKKHNLGPHNVSIENKKTGEVHGAKVHPTQGVYKRTYKNLD